MSGRFNRHVITECSLCADIHCAKICNIQNSGFLNPSEVDVGDVVSASIRQEKVKLEKPPGSQMILP